ncbi:MAG TPA: hypothetical protein VJO53_09500 [Candidatus Acidoferrales bacterium]|nr:hypothetical protein [Candidatus Acidoferrales bacterium]
MPGPLERLRRGYALIPLMLARKRLLDPFGQFNYIAIDGSAVGLSQVTLIAKLLRFDRVEGPDRLVSEFGLFSHGLKGFLRLSPCLLQKVLGLLFRSPPLQKAIQYLLPLALNFFEFFLRFLQPVFGLCDQTLPFTF